MDRVREYLNEKFSEESDPIKDMGIGPLAQILKKFPEYSREEITSQSTYNDILVIGVTHYAENTFERINLIKFCVKQGANQLWYEDDVKFPDIITALYRVTGAGIPSSYSYRTIKIYFEPVYNIWQDKEIMPGDKRSSVDFRNKYTPVNQYFLDTLDHIIKSAEKIKSVVDKLK